MLNGGVLNGVRILAPATVALMRSNHLPDSLMDNRFGIGIQRMRPGFGFGYDVAVFDDPQKAGSTTGKGSFSGMAQPAPGSGSIRPTTSCSSA